ncbi:leukosialin [Otolemur garnettii]|uniref:leukosialin n=1 Tax=Otolemur garnettii TaxID=30611 RepID=UPI000C7EE8B8|nr:leukosialin [Otolemur garnettii]
MPVALEMALLLLFWALVGSPEALGSQTALPPVTLSPGGTFASSALNNYEAFTSEKDSNIGSTGGPISNPPSTPFMTNELSSLGTSIDEERPTQTVSLENSSVLLETLTVASDPAVSTVSHTVTGGIMTTDSLEITNGTNGPPMNTVTSFLETSHGAGGPPVTMATGFLETSHGASGPSATIATNPLDTSHGASGPPVTMATNPLETSHGASGPPVTMATNPLETSHGASGPHVTMATSSLETSHGASGPPVTMTTNPLETSHGTSGPTISMTTSSVETSHGAGVKISTVITPIIRPSPNPDERSNKMLLVAVLVALLVVIILIVLLLLWRQRQKQRTGALTLNRDGKRNGVVDAWAGPAQVSDEGTVAVTMGGPGDDKGSGVPNGEGSGQRPTLTTFFGRRKSRQDSVALEELKSEPGPSLKGEKEPLMGSEERALEAPFSDGSEAGDGAALQSS